MWFYARVFKLFMSEVVLEAIVLGSETRGEYDRLVHAYTRELGRVEARVVSGRKIRSRLFPHLMPGSRIFLRLAHKHQYTVTDALTEELVLFEAESPYFHIRFPRILALVRALTHPYFPDPRFWHALLSVMQTKNTDISFMLRLLGYDMSHARCGLCEEKNLFAFSLSDHAFTCSFCSSRFQESDLVFLN